jgi:hypothetical protein
MFAHSGQKSIEQKDIRPAVIPGMMRYPDCLCGGLADQPEENFIIGCIVFMPSTTGPVNKDITTIGYLWKIFMAEWTGGIEPFLRLQCPRVNLEYGILHFSAVINLVQVAIFRSPTR